MFEHATRDWAPVLRDYEHQTKHMVLAYPLEFRWMIEDGGEIYIFDPEGSSLSVVVSGTGGQGRLALMAKIPAPPIGDRTQRDQLIALLAAAWSHVAGEGSPRPTINFSGEPVPATPSPIVFSDERPTSRPSSPQSATRFTSKEEHMSKTQKLLATTKSSIARGAKNGLAYGVGREMNRMVLAAIPDDVAEMIKLAPEPIQIFVISSLMASAATYAPIPCAEEVLKVSACAQEGSAVHAFGLIDLSLFDRIAGLVGKAEAAFSRVTSATEVS